MINTNKIIFFIYDFLKYWDIQPEYKYTMVYYVTTNNFLHFHFATYLKYSDFLLNK